MMSGIMVKTLLQVKTTMNQTDSVAGPPLFKLVNFNPSMDD